MKTKNLLFRNYSYVITYLIAQEIMTIGNISGWFDVIKDVSIYLENQKDKKSLKSERQTLKAIQNRN